MAAHLSGSTCFAFAMISTVAGCYASHGWLEAPAGGAPDSAVGRDATVARLDASTEGRVDAHDTTCGEPRCSRSAAAIRVRIEPAVPAGASRACAFGPIRGEVTSVTPAPDEQGVSIRLQSGSAPGCRPGSECECVITVSGIGSDVRIETPATPQYVSGSVGSDHVELFQDVACFACEGCPCATGAVLVAAYDGPAPSPDSVAAGRSRIRAMLGAAACSSPDGAGGTSTRRLLHVAFDPGVAIEGASTIDVDEGETRTFAGTRLSVKSVRSSAHLCAGAPSGEPTHAWVAWEPLPPL